MSARWAPPPYGMRRGGHVKERDGFGDLFGETVVETVVKTRVCWQSLLIKLGADFMKPVGTSTCWYISEIDAGVPVHKHPYTYICVLVLYMCRYQVYPQTRTQQGGTLWYYYNVETGERRRQEDGPPVTIEDSQDY